MSEINPIGRRYWTWTREDDARVAPKPPGSRWLMDPSWMDPDDPDDYVRDQDGERVIAKEIAPPPPGQVYVAEVVEHGSLDTRGTANERALLVQIVGTEDER